MNRKTVKIDKDLFDEIMFTDYLEWGTLLDDNIDSFWIENDDFRNDLVQVKTPTQLDNWYKEFENMYRNGQLNDDVHVAMYEFLNLMTIWRKSPYFSEGMDSLSLGLVESYFLYALYFWSLIYLSTTSLLMLPREPR